MEPLPSIDDRILAAVERLAQARRSHAQMIATAQGLSPLQVDVLVLLHRHRDFGTSALARELDVSVPTVTDAVRVLINKDLVSEEVHRKDRRKKILKLNAAARKIVTDVLRDRTSVRTCLESSATEPKAATLNVLLQLIRDFHHNGALHLDRSCATCRYHRKGRGESWTCMLLEQSLTAADLRVDCPEHEPAN